MFSPLLLLPLLSPAAAPPRPDFALRDGDTVVFLGDSITAARTYGKIIEDYTLLRFPGRKVRFINAGKGGDTAAGGSARLQRDVLAHDPTVLIVAYGVNDIGWGVHADEPHKQKYAGGIAGIVDACRKRRVRVWVCSAAITAEDPDKGESSFLQKMCDEGLSLARSKGAFAIDVQRGMRAVQRRLNAYNDTFVKDRARRESMHAADGVHLNDLGQLAMAFAILKGLHAPRDVSSVHIGRGGKVFASGCRVSDVSAGAREVRFTRLDDGLPFNHGIFYTLNYRFVPVPEELNRYLLRVEGLAGGKYEVRADDRLVGTFEAAQLARGVNIASTTGNAWEPGGPWNAQADALRSVTEARHQLALGGVQANAYLPGQPVSAELDRQAKKINADLETLQRSLARPRPYRFVIRPALADPAPGKAAKG